MDLEPARKRRVRQSLIVDEILHCLAHFQVTERRVLLIEHQIKNPASRIAVDGERGVCRDCGKVFRIQVAGNIHIAPLEQQALSRGLHAVTHDHARHRGGAAPVIGIDVQRVALPLAPLDQAIGAGAGRFGPEPAIAPIAVQDAGHDERAVDDAGDGGGKRVHDEGFRIGLVRGQPEGSIILGDQGFLHVLGGQAELGQDHRAGPIHRDRAAQRKGHVLGGHRIARGEGQPGPDLEGEDAPVL